MPEQIALKFPAGTRDRVRSLALPGESMTSVLLRALERLEATADQAPPPPQGNQPVVSESPSELLELTSRVEHLERLFGVRTDCPTRAAILDRIRSLRAAGLGGVRIAAILNREGVPTLSGRGRWHPPTIDKLLTASLSLA